MAEKLPIVAAIPKYNMADSLVRLLPRVLEQGYDDVYVLDDASTDHSREAATPFGRDIHFIAGKKNVGPGANRNRMLAALSKEAIIHFIDADVRLISSQNPTIIRELFQEHPQAGAIGGLIRLPDNTPWIFNYGPRYSLFSIVGGWAQAVSESSDTPQLVSHLIDKTSGWRHQGFPDPSKTPISKEVFWVSEANFCISSQIFKEAGGFDPELRYHETQDLSNKLHQRGYKTWFSPSFAVEHPDVELNGSGRKSRASKASWQIIRKYGLPLK